MEGAGDGTGLQKNARQVASAWEKPAYRTQTKKNFLRFAVSVLPADGLRGGRQFMSSPSPPAPQMSMGTSSMKSSVKSLMVLLVSTERMRMV